MSQLTRIESNEDVQQLIAKLMESGEMFSNAFHGTVDAKAISRLNDGTFIDANDRWFNLFGMTRNEVIGHTSLELNIWVDSQDREEFIKRLEDTWFFNEKEMRFCRKNGDLWIALMSAQVLELGGEKVILSSIIDITERKKSEQALKESEEKFSKAFHGSAAATYITRLSDGKILDANDQGLKMLGYSRDELVGKTTVESNIWLSNRDRQDVIEELKQKGSISNKELQLRRKNGQVWTALHFSQVIELQGEMVMLSSLVDITDRKRIEEELRKSEEKFAKAFNGNAANMLLARADDGRIVDVNDAMLEDTGYSREELVGRSTILLGIWKYPEQRDLFISDIRKHGFVHNRECDFIKKNGTRGVRLMSGQLMTLDGVELLLSSSTDITERKTAEEALFKSQQMLQLVLDSVPNRVFWKDLNLNYLGCNKTAAKDAGLSDPSEMIGKNDYELAWKDSAPSYRTDDRQVMESGVPKINYEEKQEQSDGNTLWLRTSKVPLRDQEGRIIGILGTYEDITERKEMEEELKRSNEELKQFAYVASHDLQEPLRMVTAYLDLLEKRYEGKVLDEKGEHFIHMARDGSIRMKGMINDLLAYSRIETRGKPFSRVNMNEVLATAVEDLKASIQENKASVTHESLPIVKADHTQMILLLENLIGNAIKFQGQEVPRIHVSSRPHGGEWVFSVRDNGIGIAREQQDRIFDMFQRLHTREEYKGSGIGLAVAKKIVERHDGRIWVESEEGKGSTFLFTIPKRR